MDDAGNTKDDLKLPLDDELAGQARAAFDCLPVAPPLTSGPANAMCCHEQIKSGFDEGKELVVTVLKVR